MVVSDVLCPNAVDRYASNDDVRRAYHAAAAVVAAACWHWNCFVCHPTWHSSACLACRDMSRNKFTKVKVAAAPSLTKLYGPNTRHGMRTGLAIVRVIMLLGHSCTYSSINPDFTHPVAWLRLRMHCAACVITHYAWRAMHAAGFGGGDYVGSMPCIQTLDA